MKIIYLIFKPLLVFVKYVLIWLFIMALYVVWKTSAIQMCYFMLSLLVALFIDNLVIDSLEKIRKKDMQWKNGL